MIKNIDWSLFIPESILEKFSQQQRALRRIKRKDIITLEEAAVYLGCDAETVVETVEKGELPGGKLGGKWYFRTSCLKNHFDRYHYEQELDEPKTTEYLYYSGNEFPPTKSYIITQFLEAYQAGERNFNDLEMIKANLSNLVLPKVDLSTAILIDTNLSNTDLSLSWLKNAYLMNVNFQGANLSGVNFQGSDLSNANLQCANLTNAILSQTLLTGINLTGSILNGTIF